MFQHQQSRLAAFAGAFYSIGLLLVLATGQPGRVPMIDPGGGGGRMATATPPACVAEPLGPATDFNLFVLGDLRQGGADTGGRVAAGGDVTLTDYSIGAALPATGSRESLVAGGTLDYRRGAVAGGDVVSVGAGRLDNVSFAPTFGYRRAAPLDFARAGVVLRDLAGSYAARPATGATRSTYSRLELTGAAPGLNVFAVSAADLASASSVTVRVPAGATILVNIGGAAVSLGNLGFDLGAANSSSVLLNMPEATSLTLAGLGLGGSILAPSAAITFRDGAVDGTIVGASLSGAGHLSRAPFVGCIAPR